MNTPGIIESRLIRLARAMVDQQRAGVVVSPQQNAAGFWFGGGNMIEDSDGTLYLVGRYRNAGDSRLGVGAGERGLELAVFASQDRGQSFQKLLSFAKRDLCVDGRDVLSIEGSALHWTAEGVELFVSTEKTGIGYPAGFEDYQKAGTGVWTIERLQAENIDALGDAEPRTVLASRDPRFLHVKDPFVYDTPAGETAVLFCSHPFCWTSSNTGYAVSRQRDGTFDRVHYDFFPRGFTWDVAMTRGTAIIDVPAVGVLHDRSLSLLFYDGGECVRDLDAHQSAVERPRGYSCEELGGAAYIVDGDLANVQRLSEHLPMFVSPWGTGCSRYVDVHRSRDGLFVTWQQSQQDRSQPLVMNFLSNERVEELLG